jgi:DNA-directed RNA polymerase subunit N (RpoN/RPB10)
MRNNTATKRIQQSFTSITERIYDLLTEEAAVDQLGYDERNSCRNIATNANLKNTNKAYHEYKEQMLALQEIASIYW